MNVFWLDEDPTICAQYHCDRHVGKMLLESVQIMCTVLNKHLKDKAYKYIDYGDADPKVYLRLADKINSLPYKPTHPNHPIVIWAGDCTGNFKKLSLLATKLANEFEYRFGKPHKSAEALRSVLELTNMNQDLPLDDHTDSRPPLCTLNPNPTGDVVGNYREYYKIKKKEWENRDKPLQMVYTKRNKPNWLED